MKQKSYSESDEASFERFKVQLGETKQKMIFLK